MSKHGNKSHKKRKEGKEQRAQRAQRELRGGLDNSSTPANRLAALVNIEQVSSDTYRQREELSWSERLRDAFNSGCNEFLTEEAQKYYGESTPGRQPFYCYLRMDVVIRLSLAYGRKLTIGEMKLLVSEDGPVNSQVCRHQLRVKHKAALMEINDRRRQLRQEPVRLEQVSVTEDMVTQCRFTPVRWVHLPLDVLIQSRFFNIASDDCDLLKTLATTSLWQYLGNFYDMPDPTDPAGKKTREMPISGAPWKFMHKLGKYDMFPGSPLIVMFKMNPKRVEARASVGVGYIDDLYRAECEKYGQTMAARRELSGDSAAELWSGDILSMYDKVLGS